MAKVDVEPDLLASEQEIGGSPDVPEGIVGRSPGELFWRRFRKDRFALAGIAFLILITLLGVGAPLFAQLVGHPVDSQYIFEMTNEFGVPLGPTLNADIDPAVGGKVFVFGADGGAHDLFIRILYGARTSLIVALSATLLEMVLGVTLGMMAGFYRGKVDTLVSRMTDIFYALPTLLLILGLVAACGVSKEGCLGGFLKPGRLLVAVVIGFFGWPYIARIVRGQVLSLREKEFVEAARALGARSFRTCWRRSSCTPR
jgi:ABC-type dipeptide/oligopeptide/nickel transport system permease subunit